MLHGCTNEPIAEPVEENIIETRASGNNITVFPADFGGYLLTDVMYTFDSPYAEYFYDPLSRYFVRWKIGGNWNASDFYFRPPQQQIDGRFIHLFNDPGVYTIRSGKFQGITYFTPVEEQVRTYTVLDSFDITVTFDALFKVVPYQPGIEYRFRADIVSPIQAEKVRASWDVWNTAMPPLGAHHPEITPIYYPDNSVGIIFPENGRYAISASMNPNTEYIMTVTIGGSIIFPHQ